LAHCGSLGLAGLYKSHRPALPLPAAPGTGSHQGNRFGLTVTLPRLTTVTQNFARAILCPRSPIFIHRVQPAAVLVDALNGAHDLARWDADLGERLSYDFKLIRFDLAVSRTFDLIQEPA